MLLCLCMIAGLFVGVVSTEASADGFTNGGYTYEYTVKSNGTSVSSICSAIGLPYDYCKQAIYILNGWDYSKSDASLPAGTTVILPNGVAVADLVITGNIKVSTSTGTSSSTTTATTGTLQNGDYIAYYLIPHTVLSNETLYSICNELGVSYNTYATLICNMSGITNTRNVKAGTVVYIPTLTAPTSGTYYCVVAHKVQKNETAISICNSYNVNYYNFYTVLEGLNSSINLNYVKVGQTMYLPVPSASVTPTVAPTATVTPTATVSPSASPVTGYAINFNNEGKGTTYCVVGTDTNATRAQAGDKVTIYPEPTAKYAVHAITVTRDDNNAYVTVTDNSFTMPASAVTINVLFEKGDYAINCLTPTYGTFDTYVGGAVASAADYGDSVMVTVEPDAGYVVDSVVYQKSDGKIAQVSVTDDDDDGIYEFLMPNYDVNVSVSFKKAVTKNISYKVTYSGAQTLIGSTTAIFEYAGKTLSGGAAPVGGIVYMTVSPESAKSVDEVIVPGSTVYDLGGNIYYFKMPNAETVVEIKLTDAYGEERTTHKLTEIDHSSTSFLTLSVTDSETGNVDTWATEAKAGDKVVLAPFPLSGWVYQSAEVMYSDGSSKVTVYNDGANDYFIMPDYDVTVTSTFVQDNVTKYGVIKYYDASLQSNSWEYRCYNSSGVEQYCFTPGEEVSIEVVPDAGYAVDKVTATYEMSVWWFGTFNWTTTLKADSSGLYSLKMPNSHVTLNLTFKQGSEFAKATLDVMKLSDSKAHGSAYLQANGHNIEFAENDLGLASSIYKEYVASSVGVGTTLEVVTLPESGYQVDYVKVRSAGWLGLTSTKTIKADEDGRYYYTVTKSDVKTGITFEVMYKEIDYSSLTKYAVQYAYSEYGMYDIIVNEDEANEAVYSGEAGKAAAGDYVTLVVYPATGYDYESIIIDGEVREAVPGASGNYTYTFQMPSHAVATEVTYVKANYGLINQGCYDEDNNSVTASFTFKVGSVQNAKTAQYKDVVQVIPTAVGSLEVTSVQYKFHDETEWHYAKDNRDKDGTFTFTMDMPADVDVRGYVEERTYSVTSGDITAPVTAITYSDDSGSTWAAELEDVTADTEVSACITLADDYKSYESLSVLVNGKEVAVIETADVTSPVYVSFTMPAEDAVVTVVPTANTFTVSASDDATADLFQSLTTTGKKYAYGSTVTESLALPDDAKAAIIWYDDTDDHDPFAIKKLFDSTVAEGESSEVAGASFDPVTNTIYFTMPAHDVVLTVIPEYAINVVGNANADITITGANSTQADVDYALSGDVITVSVDVDDPDDYKVTAIKVTTLSGEEVEVDSFAYDSTTGIATASFEMPDEAVTVEATVTPIGKTNITVKLASDETKVFWNASAGSVSKVGTTDKTASFVAAENDLITITVAVNSGYDLADDIAFTGIDEDDVNVTKTKTNPNTYIIKFYAPENDVTVTLETEPLESTKEYSVAFKILNSGSSWVQFYSDEGCSKEISKAIAGATVYAKLSLDTKYTLGTPQLRYIDGAGITYDFDDLQVVTTTGNDDDLSANNVKYSFPMPAKDINVILNASRKFSTISVSSAGNGSIKLVDDANNAIDTSKVYTDTKITPVVSSHTTGYVLDHYEVRYTTTAGEAIDLVRNPGESFTMPDVPVTVTAVFVEKTSTLSYSAADSVDISNLNITATISGTTKNFNSSKIENVKYESTIVVTITGKDGYRFDDADGAALTWTGLGTDAPKGTAVDGGYKYTVTMPANDLSFTINKAATASNSISCTSTGGATVSITDASGKALSSYVDSGTTVTVTVTAPSGKTVTKVEWTGVEDPGTAGNYEVVDGGYKYTITMPSNDVSFAVTVS